MLASVLLVGQRMPKRAIGYLANHEGKVGIYVLDVNRSIEHLFANDVLDYGYGFVWSPDGGRIGFLSRLTGMTVMDFGGHAHQPDLAAEAWMAQFVSNPYWEGGWNQAGTKRVFELDFEIYICDRRCDDRHQVTNDQLYLNYSPSWSPDEQEILFSSYRGGDLEIYVMKRDGTDVRRLTYNDTDDGYPAWSPDGTQIIFASLLSNRRWELFMMNADGTGLHRLTYNRANEGLIVWQP
jgi:Tol biopolymer transport system component